MNSSLLRWAIKILQRQPQAALVMAGGAQGVREEETFMGVDPSWQCICGISFPNSWWRKEQSKEVPACISDLHILRKALCSCWNVQIPPKKSFLTTQALLPAYLICPGSSQFSSLQNPLNCLILFDLFSVLQSSFWPFCGFSKKLAKAPSGFSPTPQECYLPLLSSSFSCVLERGLELTLEEYGKL